MRRLTPLLLVFAALVSPARGRAAAPSAPAEHPMVRDTLARLEQAGRAEPDPEKRRILLRDAAQGVPRALYPGIMDALAPPAPGSLESEIARAVFLRWTWETPDYAAAWAAASPPGAFRRDAMADAASRWAQVNPREAAKWAQSLDAGERRPVLASVGDYLRRVSPSSLDAWEQAVGPTLAP